MSQQINLFNPVFLKEKRYFSAVTMLQALGLLLLGVLAFYGYASFQTKELSRQAEQTGKQHAQLQERLARTTAEYAPQKADANLEAEAARLQAEINSRQALISSMGSGVLGKDSGYAEYMRAFARQSLDGLWLTGFKVGEGGAQMEISGRALLPDLVPSYIRRLNRERIMQGRAFDALTLTQKRAVLPARAAPRPGDTPAGYSYTEFQLVSSHAQLIRHEDAEAAAAPEAARRARIPAGRPR